VSDIKKLISGYKYFERKRVTGFDEEEEKEQTETK
jgi:hypothetical protein